MNSNKPLWRSFFLEKSNLRTVEGLNEFKYVVMERNFLRNEQPSDGGRDLIKSSKPTFERWEVGEGGGALSRAFTAYRVHYNSIYCYCASSGYFSMPRESRRKVIARFMNL